MSLVEPRLFIGAGDQTSYLRSAGQGLVPQTAQAAASRYLNIRGGLIDDTLLDCYWQCKEQVATLMQADAEDIAFMGSTSDACGAITSLIDWQPGDEVVLVSDTLEFPSVTLSVRHLERQGVAIREVSAPELIVAPSAISEAITSRTRLVFVSHVSYRTGHRFCLKELSDAVRATGDAWLAVDASQSLGVVPVDAKLCDFVVSTAFKWTLGAHGVALLFWNRARLPDVVPSAIGWHSVLDDSAGSYQWKTDAQRFEPGNPPFLPIAVLSAGLNIINSIGVDAIAPHAMALGTQLLDGLKSMGYTTLTPADEGKRAGIVSWLDADCGNTAAKLEQHGVKVTGNVGRIRASFHLYNSASDVERLLHALGNP